MVTTISAAGDGSSSEHMLALQKLQLAIQHNGLMVIPPR
jgi:hypothetical protein